MNSPENTTSGGVHYRRQRTDLAILTDEWNSDTDPRTKAQIALANGVNRTCAIPTIVQDHLRQYPESAFRDFFCAVLNRPENMRIFQRRMMELLQNPCDLCFLIGIESATIEGMNATNISGAKIPDSEHELEGFRRAWNVLGEPGLSTIESESLPMRLKPVVEKLQKEAPGLTTERATLLDFGSNRVRTLATAIRKQVSDDPESGFQEFFEAMIEVPRCDEEFRRQMQVLVTNEQHLAILIEIEAGVCSAIDEARILGGSTSSMARELPVFREVLHALIDPESND